MFDFLKRKKKYTLTKQRDFKTKYFLDLDIQMKFERDGYVVLKDVVSAAELQDAYRHFLKLSEMEGYNVTAKFESSGNFVSKYIQEFVFRYVNKFISDVAPRFANFENCEIGSGGAFFIKPNTKDSFLAPHQDSAVIDESKYYGIFLWIPIQDINSTNGALYVLPGSHLWGNFCRSQHIPWAFRKHEKFLWSKMIPLYVNKGDIVCFDTSIIHGSSVNYSDLYRLVLCGALLPKKYQMVEYAKNNGSTIRYLIDDTYWLDGGRIESLHKYPSENIQQEYPNPISLYELKKNYIACWMF